MHALASKLSLTLAAALATVLCVSPARADEKGTLQIWIAGDKAFDGLTKVGQRFTKDTSIKVIVERVEDAPAKFQQAVAKNAGPSIIIATHEHARAWISAGLVDPVTPKPKTKAAIEPVGWDAFTVSDKAWGYPLVLEAVGLVYNKALVPKPPASFEDVIALDKKLAKTGKHAILWEYDNPLFSFPLLAANGGYAFGRGPTGEYIATDVGVSTPGAVQGAEMLVKLVEAGVMPKDATVATAEAAMKAGDVAMTLTGSWAWETLRKSKIKFGVAPIPSVGGKASKPFIVVEGAMINRASTNKEVAISFIESYLLTADGLRSLDQDVTLGIPADKAFQKTRTGDPAVAGVLANLKNGVLMPSLPEMSKFWSAMSAALPNITQKRQKPVDALSSAAARMKAN